MTCQVCQYELHAKCFNDHQPCPDGWNNKEKSISSDLSGAFNQAAPVTPPAAPDTSSQATAIYQKSIADMELIQQGGQPLAQQPQQQQYPNSS